MWLSEPGEVEELLLNGYRLEMYKMKRGDGGNGYTPLANTASLSCTLMGKTEPRKHRLK